MKFKTFKDSGWNPKVIEYLNIYECNGVELSEKTPNEILTKKKALSLISYGVLKIFPSPSLWIFTGHEVFQDNSKTVNLKKLWRSIGISISVAVPDAVEWSVVSDDGVKFFGILDKSLISDDDILRLWATLKTTWLVVFNGRPDIKEISKKLEFGWESKIFGFPKVLLDLASGGNMILVSDFGSSNDGEGGLIAIGKKELISILISK